ncbi:MAG: RIP metalloprotease RseP [Rhodothalassiaceae bacterium]
MDAPGLLFTLAAFGFAIGLLLFVHEWGHYFVARLLGVRAETFSVGMGPEVFGWTDKRGTRWRLSALPLGGYVKFFGDMGPASRPDPETLATMSPEERASAFHLQPLWRRAAIIAAGPAINLVFAVLLFAALFVSVGRAVTPPVVPDVLDGSPAAEAGLLPGDRIVRAAGQPIDSFEGLIQEIRLRANVPLDLTVQREGRQLDMTIVPEAIEAEDRFGNRYTFGRIGVPVPQTRETERYGPFGALAAAVEQTGRTVRLMAEGLRQIILGIRSLDDLGGPVKIAKLSGEQAFLGAATFVTFLAVISINLGLVNLLPIPILDGGHLLFYAIEALKGAPLSERVQEWGYAAGLAMVLGLMLLLTLNDLMSL